MQKNKILILFIIIILNLYIQKKLFANNESCFNCHLEIKNLWDSGKHKEKLSCNICHDRLQNHGGFALSNTKKPTTNLTSENCGKCHSNQFKIFFAENLKKSARLEKSLATERVPSPLWDKLIMGYSFAKERNSPRSHAYMLIDHLIS